MSKRDPDTWMWERARELLEKAERSQKPSFQLGAPRRGGPHWEPPVDVFESEDELRVRVALPGIQLEDIEVLFHDRELLVSGTSRPPEMAGQSNVHRIEIPRGRFERRVELPARCGELVRQELEDGCLLLVWRKAEEGA